MSAVATAARAHVPGPPELLPGRPDAVVDLQTAEGCALVAGEWRYSDAEVAETEFVALAGPGAADPLGPGDVPNRTYEVLPHAEGADFDDSGWRVLAPEETMRRLANGRVCFNWYRIAVTIPERLGDLDPTGATVVFEVVVDDYAEVWVDGALPHALGDAGGPVVAGFNAPNRVVLTRDARPGQTFRIAVFGINGPISAAPPNYIWMRAASLELHPPRAARPEIERVAGGFESVAAPVWSPDGALLFSSPGTGAVYRLDPELERVTLFRPKSGAAGLAFSPDGLLTMAQPATGRVVRVNPHGDVSVVADAREGGVQDLVHRSDGALFFTAGAGVSVVRDGAVSLVGDELTAPGGLALAPDERRLYVGDRDPDHKAVVRYDLAGGGPGQELCDLTAEPGEEAVGGIAVAPDGRMYVCGPGGIWVLSPSGERLELIELPEAPHDLAWGDADGRSLYATAMTSIYRIRRNP